MKRKHFNIYNDKTTRDISTAVRKFCLLTPELQRWRAQRRFVALLWSFRVRGRLKVWKDLMNYTARLVLETRSPNPQPACKFPRFLKPLVRWGRKDLRNCNAVLSILNVHRLVYLSPVKELNSIRDPFTGRWPNAASVKMLQRACRRFVREHPKGAVDKEFSWAISWAAGPNGRPAWDKVLEDFIAVHSTYLGHYVSYFLEVFSLKCGEQIKSDLCVLRDYLKNWDPGVVEALEPIRGDKTHAHLRRPSIGQVLDERKVLAKRISKIRFYGVDTPLPFKGSEIAKELFKEPFDFERGMKILSELPHASRPVLFDHSRLHFLADKAGKTRGIALGDVLTQTLCTPLEREIFRRLRSTLTDGTFDQDRQRVRVREATREKACCFSIDMKSCTDRLPALYQALCLHYSGLLTKEQALAWYLLMVKRVFSFGRRRTMAVTYSVGQPMGFHSSWAVMAFSHHCLVRWAANLVGLESFQDYALLGDDIVIWNATVARSYLNLLADLGVQISVSKSFSERGLAEFAKSYYRVGEDLKPLSASVLIWRRDFGPAMLVEIAQQLSSKGLIEWTWLTKAFGHRQRWSDISTILAVYGVSAFLSAETRPPTEKEKYLSSAWDLKRKLERSKTQAERDAESALKSHFMRSKLDLLSDLWKAPRKWGVMPKVGPAWRLFLIQREKSFPYEAAALQSWGSKLVQLSLDPRVLVGDNWVSWDDEYWGLDEKSTPLNLIEERSLDQSTHDKLRYQGLKLQHSSLVRLFYKPEVVGVSFKIRLGRKRRS